MPKKRIVLCFDGTWNSPTGGETNVWHIHNALLRDETIQEVKYYKGVGARYIGVRGLIDRALGGMTGYGISSNIKIAYDFIVNKYTAGADIYLLGFSRGAHTARSLSGFLHLVGVIDDDKRDEYRSEYGTDLIEDAYIYYRLPVEESGNIITRTLQQGFFGANTRSTFKKGNRAFQFILDDAKHKGYRTATMEDGTGKDVNYESITIEFLGVWDTVGALGAPVPGLASVTAPWVSFHDTRLSPNVKKAYQALALHELRKHFIPVFWTEKREEQRQQTVEQAWFAGSHSNVGGGLEYRGLSNLSLQWMIEQARKAGLSCNPEASDIEKGGDVTEPVETSRTLPWQVFKPIMRDIPYPSEEEVQPDVRDYIYAHPSVRQRLERVTTSKERLHHIEPVFKKIDEASKQIRTRDECLDEIRKREAMQAKQKDMQKLIAIARSLNSPSFPVIHEEEDGSGVTIGPVRISKKQSI